VISFPSVTTPYGRKVLDRLEGLLQERQARGVANKAQITETHISKWRGGHVNFNPKLDTLEQMARALDITVGELVGDAPTFDERLAAMGPDEKLALAQRLLAELREHKP
jgi:transcriptional regulator with XRE-family HTH domain